MAFSSRLDEALGRLNGALHRLQAAAERRAEIDAGRADRDAEFTLLQEDRARLAGELDAALARGERLRAAQDEVVHRLDGAGRTVERVMRGLAVAGEAR